MAYLNAESTIDDLTSVGDASRHCPLEVALLTGSQDPSYALGLASALNSKNVLVHVIGNRSVDNAKYHQSQKVTFVNLGDLTRSARFLTKLVQLFSYYARLLSYATLRGPKLIHVLWNNKIEYFDRVALMIYFKLAGKKVILTAHNINKRKRDLGDSLFNRLTLRIQYSLVDHIFVHTEKMKRELLADFDAKPGHVTVVPFGVNVTTPETDLTPATAKQRLGIGSKEKTILFFGRIVGYKGLEYLVDAFQYFARREPHCRLLIAGEPMKGYETYLNKTLVAVRSSSISNRVIQRLEYIPDEETELYFKAADVLILPYKNIFESGVMFLAFRFGLPVIAADVGSFREEISGGAAGFLFKAGDSLDLARTMEIYFESDLYKSLPKHRERIQQYVGTRHSWDIVGEATKEVYSKLLPSF